jgi:bifunctional non-homologous end joining protein LigD
VLAPAARRPRRRGWRSATRRVCSVSAEGIVAKRRAGLYRAGPGREWLKTKCSEVGKFVITGFRDLTPSL